MQQLSRIIATMGGIGYAPIAPGTAASLVAVGLWYCWYPGVGGQWTVCLVAIVVGIWAGDVTARHLGTKDPSAVVIDEFAGMWLVLAGLPKSLPIVCAAFLLFRFFDITKLPPMRQLERLPGGMGIMLDDLAAAVISRIILEVALRFF